MNFTVVEAKLIEEVGNARNLEPEIENIAGNISIVFYFGSYHLNLQPIGLLWGICFKRPWASVFNMEII